MKLKKHKCPKCSMNHMPRGYVWYNKFWKTTQIKIYYIINMEAMYGTFRVKKKCKHCKGKGTIPPEEAFERKLRR